MSVNLFKGAINGYSRTDVDQYIFHISKKHEQEKKNYERKIEILEAEIAKLKKENQKTSEMLKEDEAIISAFQQKLNPEVESNKSAEIENESLFIESEETIVIEKSKRYDEISRQLGEIIINANADASLILRRAEESAAEIKSKAAEEIKKAAIAAADALTAIGDRAENELLSEKTDNSRE